MRTLLNHLIFDNPMSQEGVRTGRRFLRTGGETGKAVNFTIIALLGVIYVWLLLTILRYREDMSAMLIGFELGILTLAVPASLYGAVSGEREKLTWDSLIMTRLTPAQIIAGKLVWRLLLIVGVMALFTVPILLCHFASGIVCTGDTCGNGGAGTVEYSMPSIISAQFMIFAWSLFIAALTFFVSTKTRRPVTSLSIVTVSLLAFLALVPILVGMFDGQVEWRQFDSSPLNILGSLLIHLNPFYDMALLSTSLASRTDGDLWRIFGLTHALPFLYAFGAALLLKATHRSLRSLEAPRRTIG